MSSTEAYHKIGWSCLKKQAARINQYIISPNVRPVNDRSRQTRRGLWTGQRAVFPVRTEADFGKKSCPNFRWKLCQRKANYLQKKSCITSGPYL
jgi:hypothetical protein